jgi:hypothetical protein
MAYLLQQLFLNIADYNLRSILDKAFRDRCAYAPSASGNKCYFPIKSAHSVLSSIFAWQSLHQGPHGAEPARVRLRPTAFDCFASAIFSTFQCATQAVKHSKPVQGFLFPVFCPPLNRKQFREYIRCQCSAAKVVIFSQHCRGFLGTVLQRKPCMP